MPTKKTWEEKMMTINPKANPAILTFIWKFVDHTGGGARARQTVISLFESGYCYYFAKMLEDNFDGELMWVKNVGHVVFMAENGVAYDISGVYYDYDETDLVPMSILGDAVEIFKHGPVEFSMTEEDILTKQVEAEARLNEWEMEHNLPLSHKVRDYIMMYKPLFDKVLAEMDEKRKGDDYE